MKTTPSTPKKALHNYCHNCVQSRRDEDVENCGGEIVYATGQQCPFYGFRMGGKRPPMKAFRLSCLECMGGSYSFVRDCECTDCLIHAYRFGKNPHRKGASKDRMSQIRRPGTTFSAIRIC